MKRLAILALLLSGAATAATVTVNWTNPTTNTDGTSIPASGAGSLTQARIEYGTCNGTAFGASLGNVNRTMPTSTGTVNLTPANYCFRVFVANTYGNESAASNVSVHTVASPIPNPPTNLTVSSPVVFDLRRINSQFYLSRHIGSIPVGSPAVRRFTVANGANYCEVSRDRVNHVKSSTDVLVARCT